ncbi:hypothetical protein T12_15274 [Trichinella patagoniensis]|uniref:Uncharacterized protein n=1 Tax=Trichinella patagoniensis TaxID=990121 RepID=A0A0V1AHC2_9BILA|nr:hypothetical protein T12_15274 [Trichinella patagoniensis]
MCEVFADLSTTAGIKVPEPDITSRSLGQARSLTPRAISAFVAKRRRAARTADDALQQASSTHTTSTTHMYAYALPYASSPNLLTITKMRKNKATVSRPVLEDQDGGKRGGTAGSNRTDDTDAEMNLQIDTGVSSFNNDRGSNPVEARNEPARESGSLH